MFLSHWSFFVLNCLTLASSEVSVGLSDLFRYLLPVEISSSFSWTSVRYSSISERMELYVICVEIFICSPRGFPPLGLLCQSLHVRHHLAPVLTDAALSA